MPIERELKLAVDAEELEALLAAEPIRSCAVGETATNRLVSVYFDTPDRALRAEGFGLRIREVDGRRVQTLKRSRSDQSFARDEWEAELPGRSIDPSLVPDAEIRSRLEAVVERLEPVFTTDFERMTTLLRLPSGTEIELAVDRGEVRAGEASEPIHEVELELKSGRVADLYALAQRLHRAVPFRLGTQSKAARGFALRWPDDPPSRSAIASIRDSRVALDAAARSEARRSGS